MKLDVEVDGSHHKQTKHEKNDIVKIPPACADVAASSRRRPGPPFRKGGVCPLLKSDYQRNQLHDPNTHGLPCVPKSALAGGFGGGGSLKLFNNSFIWYHPHPNPPPSPPKGNGIFDKGEGACSIYGWAPINNSSFAPLFRTIALR